MNTTNTNNANTTNSAAATTAAKTPKTKPAAPSKPTPTTNPKRGVKKAEVVALLKNYTFPSTPFTVRDVYCSLGVCHGLIRSFVKKNAKIVGDAPKAAGSTGKARGKAAKLYQLPADKLNY
jgi:hypothetical protein